MAPIRRYLRISKYSVLECRIYLDNPALAHSWLLNPRSPVLPKVIDSVRPLVLPKLREERERSRKKSTKKRGIKDIVVEGAFPPPPPFCLKHSQRSICGAGELRGSRNILANADHPCPVQTTSRCPFS